MDEKELLAELLKSSQRTNELLSKHLFRLRFSLGTLLVLMTLLCLTLGIFVYRQQAGSVPVGGTLAIRAPTTITTQPLGNSNADATLLFDVQSPPAAR